MQFEELTAGRVVHAGPRLVTGDEIVAFARRYDSQPFHVDSAAASAGRWGGLIASGWMTCGIAMELAVQAIFDGSSSMGSPGVDELRWPHPVRPGDLLSLQVTVLDSRIASSGKTGIVRSRWELHNQQVVRVLSLIAINMFTVQERV